MQGIISEIMVVFFRPIKMVNPVKCSLLEYNLRPALGNGVPTLL